MAQLLVREVPAETVDALKKRAKAHGRSTEAEHRAILEETLNQKADDFWKEVDQVRNRLAESGRKFTDSTALVRKDRDRR